MFHYIYKLPEFLSVCLSFVQKFSFFLFQFLSLFRLHVCVCVSYVASGFRPERESYVLTRLITVAPAC